ncbi:Rne/Rng family ribonuclease [Pilimelia columellifera]|uniref:S1 motif domain-containing protein n=1 Tax=Pilimelia columellifera subsp. columellifera TaxID=706583 RepID=A0ABP6B1M3_9ACTN
MLDNEPENGEVTGTPATELPVKRTRRRAIKPVVADAAATTSEAPDAGTATDPPAVEATPKRRRAPRKAAAAAAVEPTPGAEAAPAAEQPVGGEVPPDTGVDLPAEPARRVTRRRKAAAPVAEGPAVDAAAESGSVAATTPTPTQPAAETPAAETPVAEPEAEAPSRRRRKALPPVVLFMPPEVTAATEPDTQSVAPAEAAPVTEPATERGRRRRGRRAEPEPVVEDEVEAEEEEPLVAELDEDDEDAGARRRRRGRRGRGRGKGGVDDVDAIDEPAAAEEAEETDEDEPLTRRRRRRRRKGSADDNAAEDDGVPTVVRIREPRRVSDEVQGVTGSTRLEAKRQRRRDGRDQRRTRPPILTESEFLARREAVDRVMVVRERGDRTQIAVLEDNVLVEHYVTRMSAGTMAGNVYLGKVQNVLPSMEAAFVDVGRGRNAVLYAGEVNWDATGLAGRARSIEQALKPGDPVLVQVTKDPIGHKGARLTSHVALSGRHLVYVPNGNASGISRKLPDTERKRLRDALKKLVPDGAGVIVRTAAEGASEDELARDVKRLQAQWEDIQAKVSGGNAPTLLYEEPDLVIRVVRDLFNEDFRELVIQGDSSYDEVEAYLSHVSPDLMERLRRHTGAVDVFTALRIDEQIIKGLDRKVYLPSGGHLVIDRTEAMTVVDVNTGKYTGAGGNLEETVTRNNLEAAEEIVRQLRLRDIGGIIVIDFIDMVLESNRELVLRRLTECLGRDRTKHQVTEITSLGLVQMTRKRIGAGLIEAFSENCEQCKGRGLIIHSEPAPERAKGAGERVKVVASASAPAPAKAEPSGRRRGRRGAVAEESHVDESAERPFDEIALDEPEPDEVVEVYLPIEDIADEVNGDEVIVEEFVAEPVVARRGRGASRPGRAARSAKSSVAQAAIDVVGAASANGTSAAVTPVERLASPAAPGARAAQLPVSGVSGIARPAVAPVVAEKADDEDDYNDPQGYDLSRFE